MNATSLYASTCRLMILADATDKSTWTDLFRLVPYLRQALSCSVCGQLLRAPLSPSEPECQHHVCSRCKGGRKKLKPSCDCCKQYDNYIENEQLRILLQCYKKLCEYFMGTDVYKLLLEEDEITGVNGGTVASSALIELVQEGAGFDDDYKSTAGLSKSAYSMLPCVYSNSSTAQTQAASASSTAASESTSKESPSKKPVTNGSSTYSVMYAGSGNKITIKRKAVEEHESSPPKETVKEQKETSSKSSFKKPSSRSRSSTSGKRKGCRCGNATATPGKLTCCGQRCPCYVESKPCTECKCKGCRNPHRADGLKVRPHIIKVESSQNSQSSNNADSSPSCSGSIDSMDNDSLTMDAAEDSFNYNPDLKDSKINVYSRQLQDVSPSLPATILMDEDSENSPDEDDDDDDDGNEEDDESSPQEWQVNSPPDTQDSAVSHSPPSPVSGSPQEDEAHSDIEVDV